MVYKSEKTPNRFMFLLGKAILNPVKEKVIKNYYYVLDKNETYYQSNALIFIFGILTSILLIAFSTLKLELLDKGILPILIFIIVLLPITVMVLYLVFIKIWVVFLSSLVFSKIQKIENKLPIFLREFSTNIRSGMELIEAFEESTNADLGVFEDDIENIVIQIRSGAQIEQVLKIYAQKYDSYAINETFEIIHDSYIGGGNLSEITNNIAENLETIHFLKKSAIANVSNYIIFTTVISLVIAPLMFALSYNLLDLIGELLFDASVNSGSTIIEIPKLDINLDTFKSFSRYCITIIAVSAAAIITIMKTGEVKKSPSLIIIYATIALGLYWLFFMGLEYTFNEVFDSILN